MDIMEIILLIAGGVVFILSFFIPDRKAAMVDVKELTEEERRNLIQEELASIRAQAEELAERTERALEKLSNEKIMAVDEYSETVLAQIHKNHEEAVFLYDMLNNKQISLKNTLSEVNRAVKEAEETLAAIQSKKNRTERAETGEDEKESWSRLHQEQEPEGIKPENGMESARMPQDVRTEEYDGQADEDGEIEEGSAGANNNERILALYRQGKTAMSIAKELGLGIGEVRLVIDLFRNA